jgi:CheY-like chemotaxis protein
MNNRILLVDDEVNLLHSLRRSFRGKFDITIAEGGDAALKLLTKESCFAVIVSDMQMPNVNGLQVLSEARKRCPNTVRLMLTGNIDQQTAVNAVNLGGVFRFVNKPCEPVELTKVIEEAIVHHEQLAAEKVLLSRTLIATVGLSTELLALANPQAYGRASRIKQLAKRLGEQMGVADVWQLEIAGMLSQIGCIANVGQVLAMPEPFTPFWDQILNRQAEASSQMIQRIPRLERAAAIILNQSTDSWPAEMAATDRKYARALRLLIDYDHLCEGCSTVQGLKLLEQHVTRYDPLTVELLSNLLLGDVVIQELAIGELLVGMVLESHVLTAAGDILISRGHELSETIIQRLKNFQRNGVGVQEPISVRTTVRSVAA